MKETTIDLEKELYKIVENQIEQMKKKDIGARDFSQLIASLKELKKLNALDRKAVGGLIYVNLKLLQKL